MKTNAGVSALLKRDLHLSAAKIRKCKTPEHIATILCIPLHRLQLMAAKPVYHIFEIPKSDGSMRLIENPKKDLKEVLRSLNHFLQAHYYFTKPESAFGFVIAGKRDGRPRNILTNAEAHLGMPHLINIDMEDFFHSVKSEMVHQALQRELPLLSNAALEMLSALCTHNLRLPMGSPASPVLSNFAARPLDEDMMHFARLNKMKYTRFVDDLTFSSPQPITDDLFGQIKGLIETQRFAINPEKVKMYNQEQVKEVTGLRIYKNKVSIPDEFYEELDEDLLRLRCVLEAVCSTEPWRHGEEWMEELKKRIEGRINFIGMIHGKGHGRYNQYVELYDKAMDVDDFVQSRSWLDFPYSV